VQEIKKGKGSDPTKNNKSLFLISMLIVPMLNFLIFWLYVNFQSILNAFRVEEYGEVRFSFINWKYFFEDLFSDNPYINIASMFKNTLIYFASTAVIILPLSLLLAYFLYKKIRFYRYYRVIFFLPNIVSGAVLATLYKFLFNPSVGGPVAMLISTISGNPPQNYLLTDEWALPLVLLYGIWTGFSVNLIIFTGAMGRLPMAVIEAAQIDGVNMREEFFKIMIPMMWPTLSTIIVTTVAGIFTSSGAVLLLTGGDHDTASIAFWIWITTRNQQSIYYPSTVAFCCTLVSVPLVLGVKKLTEKLYPDVVY